MSRVGSIQVNAPAKINLGLELLGKRDDGFHEIRTVMTMIDLVDTVRLSVDGTHQDLVIEGVIPEQNLITQAIRAFQKVCPDCPEVGWTVEKRIPAASGLGGASSDAAATLLGLNKLAGLPLGEAALSKLASGLGSDVPFFLGSPCGLATGRGIDTASLPAIDLDILVVVPDVVIQRKTATLYSHVRPEDFSDGSRTDQLVTALAGGTEVTQSMLANAFSRALIEFAPVITDLVGEMHRIDAGPWGLSGAGPAHYLITPEVSHPQIMERLRDRFGGSLKMFSSRTRTSPIICGPETRIG